MTGISKIGFSIVVYNEIFYQTTAFKSLVKSLEYSQASKTHIYIYDNSDNNRWSIIYDHLDNYQQIYYIHDARNPGISIAYNTLMEMSKDHFIAWMVLLDQDTLLPENAVVQYLSGIITNPDILIKAPILYVGNRIFSPFSFFFRKPIYTQRLTPGVYSFDKYGVVNSGLLIETNFFRNLGGYDPKLKLDFADFQFIKKVKQIANSFEILPIYCLQNFSHDEKDIEKALYRYSIFLEDLRNCKKQDLSDRFFFALTDLSHLVKLSFKYKSLKFLILNYRSKMKS